MLSGSSGPLTPGAGGTPPVNPFRKYLKYALGALGTAGAVFLLWKWERHEQAKEEDPYRRKPTVELPDETMEEVVWERRR